uniref:Uncharacterized protein n=1 Tax=Cannabis sativa TaxID=3483 RepID=A0A803PI01_CANSA
MTERRLLLAKKKARRDAHANCCEVGQRCMALGKILFKQEQQQQKASDEICTIEGFMDSACHHTGEEYVPDVITID